MCGYQLVMQYDAAAMRDLLPRVAICVCFCILHLFLVICEASEAGAYTIEKSGCSENFTGCFYNAYVRTMMLSINTCLVFAVVIELIAPSVIAYIFTKSIYNLDFYC